MKLFFKNKKPPVDLTDDKKWIQTSTEDLLASKELNDIIKSVERERESGEIVLAHINFETVNKEYYDNIKSLQEELKKKDTLLKKMISVTRELQNRKNRKLVELINYIKKLHVLLAYYNKDETNIEKLAFPPEEFFIRPVKIEINEDTEIIEPLDLSDIYVKADEIILDENGNEITLASDENKA